MKTIVAQQLTSKERKWYLVDAKGKNLGRLATSLARIIAGRNRVDYTPHIDNGDYVVVINAEAVTVTGNKEMDKIYRSHSQYMGGLKETPLGKMRDKNPLHLLENAVSGMLPKNKHRDTMIARLRLTIGENHQYEAQKPETITL